MKYIGKKIFIGILLFVVLLIVGFVVWMLVPPSASSLLRSTVVVEQKVWHEVCVDGKPTLKVPRAILCCLGLLPIAIRQCIDIVWQAVGLMVIQPCLGAEGVLSPLTMQCNSCLRLRTILPLCYYAVPQ